MWTYQHTETTNASREDVWAIWSDVPRWPDWDPATRKVSIDGPFAAGTHGKVTPNLGPTLKFTINDFRPLENFNFDVTMPGGVIHFGHSLSDAPGGRVAATHATQITGPLAELYGRLAGPDLKRFGPLAVRGLVCAAERRASAG